MACSMGSFALASMLVCGAAAAWADQPGTEIDLTTFGEIAEDSASAWSDIPLDDVARRLGTAPRRFYFSGMIGPSFAAVTSPSDATIDTDDTLFAAGGALGIAFERPRGQLRLEVEGMGRDTYKSAIDVTEVTDDFTLTTNNWSVMQNLWRDLMITERFGIYGGGGIGAGGYILGEEFEGQTQYAAPAANFAWQVGGGLLWEISDRLVFDVGYRYFQINTIEQDAFVRPNQFSASELMFTLRLYDPFRSWQR